MHRLYQVMAVGGGERTKCPVVNDQKRHRAEAPDESVILSDAAVLAGPAPISTVQQTHHLLHWLKEISSLTRQRAMETDHRYLFFEIAGKSNRTGSLIC